MTEIADILIADARHMLADPERIPSLEGIRSAEADLGTTLPKDYVEFCRLGGLNHLRIRHQVLAPAEILANRDPLQDPTLIPFASNGCGDLFCWRAGKPQVLFWDHGQGTASLGAPSFVEWLRRANRFY